MSRPGGCERSSKILCTWTTGFENGKFSRAKKTEMGLDLTPTGSRVMDSIYSVLCYVVQFYEIAFVVPESCACRFGPGLLLSHEKQRETESAYGSEVCA